MGLKDGCFVSSFYPPEENWPIEKCYTDRYVGLLTSIKMCYNRNGLESLLFGWFLAPLYVTGSGKSLHLRTKSEFNFIAQDSSYTKDLSIHSVSTVQC